MRTLVIALVPAAAVAGFGYRVLAFGLAVFAVGFWYASGQILP